jgi:hypothetical protein
MCITIENIAAHLYIVVEVKVWSSMSSIVTQILQRCSVLCPLCFLLDTYNSCINYVDCSCFTFFTVQDIEIMLNFKQFLNINHFVLVLYQKENSCDILKQIYYTNDQHLFKLIDAFWKFFEKKKKKPSSNVPCLVIVSEILRQINKNISFS